MGNIDGRDEFYIDWSMIMKYLLCFAIFVGILYFGIDYSDDLVDLMDPERVKKRELTTAAIIEKCRETELVHYESYSWGYYADDYMLVFSDGSAIPLNRRYSVKQANKMLKKCFEHKTESEAKALYEKFKFSN